MTSLNIKQHAPGCFEITGNLTFAAINAKTPIALKPADDNSLNLNFKHVDVSDSAGLALIFEWLTSAQDRHITLHLQNLPDQIIALAKLSGVDTMLINK